MSQYRFDISLDLTYLLKSQRQPGYLEYIYIYILTITAFNNQVPFKGDSWGSIFTVPLVLH